MPHFANTAESANWYHLLQQVMSALFSEIFSACFKAYNNIKHKLCKQSQNILEIQNLKA